MSTVKYDVSRPGPAYSSLAVMIASFRIESWIIRSCCSSGGTMIAPISSKFSIQHGILSSVISITSDISESAS